MKILLEMSDDNDDEKAPHHQVVSGQAANGQGSVTGEPILEFLGRHHQ